MRFMIGWRKNLPALEEVSKSVIGTQVWQLVAAVMAIALGLCTVQKQLTEAFTSAPIKSMFGWGIALANFFFAQQGIALRALARSDLGSDSSGNLLVWRSYLALFVANFLCLVPVYWLVPDQATQRQRLHRLGPVGSVIQQRAEEGRKDSAPFLTAVFGFITLVLLCGGEAIYTLAVVDVQEEEDSGNSEALLLLFLYLLLLWGSMQVICERMLEENLLSVIAALFRVELPAEPLSKKANRVVKVLACWHKTVKDAMDKVDELQSKSLVDEDAWNSNMASLHQMLGNLEDLNKHVSIFGVNMLKDSLEKLSLQLDDAREGVEDMRRRELSALNKLFGHVLQELERATEAAQQSKEIAEAAEGFNDLSFRLLDCTRELACLKQLWYLPLYTVYGLGMLGYVGYSVYSLLGPESSWASSACLFLACTSILMIFTLIYFIFALCGALADKPKKDDDYEYDQLPDSPNSEPATPASGTMAVITQAFKRQEPKKKIAVAQTTQPSAHSPANEEHRIEELQRELAAIKEQIQASGHLPSLKLQLEAIQRKIQELEEDLEAEIRSNSEMKNLMDELKMVLTETQNQLQNASK